MADETINQQTVKTTLATGDYFLFQRGTEYFRISESDLQSALGGSGDYSDGGDVGGAKRTLGNTDNFDMGFLANNVELVTLEASSGFVGINKTNPGYQLDVDGDIALSLTGDIYFGTNKIIHHDHDTNDLTASSFISIGYNAGAAVTTADKGTFIGSSAGLNNTSGTANTLIGANAGDQITTGILNTCIGSDVAPRVSTGAYNTLIGQGSGDRIVGSSNNTGVGARTFISGTTNITGSGNTALGYQAGQNVGGGAAENTFLGAFCGFENATDTWDNTLVLGYAGYATASNQVVFGSNTAARLYTDFHFTNPNVGLNDANVSDISFIINEPSQSGGTDNQGHTWIFKGGVSTGAGAGGDIVWQTTDQGASGTAVNTFLGAFCGFENATDTWDNTLVLGYAGYATASNQVVFGSNTAARLYTDFHFTNPNVGLNDANVSDISFIINEPSQSGGTDNQGHTWIFKGGVSTGAGAGGDIVWQTTDQGASGTAVNTRSERMRLTGVNGYLGIGEASPIHHLHIGESFGFNITAVGDGGSLSLTDAHSVVTGTAPTTLTTITLPAVAASNKGRAYVIKALDATTTVRISTTGADTIDGAASPLNLTTNYDKRTLVSDGVSDWYTI